MGKTHLLSKISKMENGIFFKNASKSQLGKITSKKLSKSELFDMLIKMEKRVLVFDDFHEYKKNDTF